MRTDSGGHQIHCKTRDSTGQEHIRFAASPPPGRWGRVSFEVGSSAGHWGGANDGKIHWPITLIQIGLEARGEKKVGHVDIDTLSVQAVGWYLAKQNPAGQLAHCKWYGFEADAVVHRPVQPSLDIDMATIRGAGTHDGKAIGHFHISTCEVPYLLWKKVHDYGDSPFWTLEPRYVCRKDGDMGSMLFGKRPHGQDEPVTSVTWYDALAWCNTLSEFEGKAPCYHVDGEFKEVFRNRHLGTVGKAKEGTDWLDRNKVPVKYSRLGPDPKVHVKWSADGHRLPAVAEWSAARGKGATDKESAWTKANSSGGTHAVGSLKPNGNGLHDMAGNVWEEALRQDLARRQAEWRTEAEKWEETIRK